MIRIWQARVKYSAYYASIIANVFSHLLCSHVYLYIWRYCGPFYFACPHLGTESNSCNCWNWRRLCDEWCISNLWTYHRRCECMWHVLYTIVLSLMFLTCIFLCSGYCLIVSIAKKDCYECRYNIHCICTLFPSRVKLWKFED